MLVLSDIRQGLFYVGLLQFWCIFAGEHILDQRDRNMLSSYKYEMGSIGIGCASLLIFDLVERGVQLRNPFHTIWRRDAGETAAKVFLVVAAIMSVLFGLFLVRSMYLALRTFRSKSVALQAMREDRRLFYEGKIYRFKTVLFTTILVILLTIVCFVLDQLNETSWKFVEDSKVNQYIIVSSAIHFGMIGMWTTYITLLLFLFSPCTDRKAITTVHYRRTDQLLTTDVDADDDTIGERPNLNDDDNDAGNDEESDVIFQHPKGI